MQRRRNHLGRSGQGQRSLGQTVAFGILYKRDQPGQETLMYQDEVLLCNRQPSCALDIEKILYLQSYAMICINLCESY